MSDCPTCRKPIRGGDVYEVAKDALCSCCSRCNGYRTTLATVQADKARLEQQLGRLTNAVQLCYDYLCCADCTSDNSAGCSRHPQLQVRANRAVSDALTSPVGGHD